MDPWKLFQMFLVISLLGTAVVAFCIHCWTKGESDD